MGHTAVDVPDRSYRLLKSAILRMTTVTVWWMMGLRCLVASTSILTPMVTVSVMTLHRWPVFVPRLRVQRTSVVTAMTRMEMSDPTRPYTPFTHLTRVAMTTTVTEPLKRKNLLPPVPTTALAVITCQDSWTVSPTVDSGARTQVDVRKMALSARLPSVRDNREWLAANRGHLHGEIISFSTTC